MHTEESAGGHSIPERSTDGTTGPIGRAGGDRDAVLTRLTGQIERITTRQSQATPSVDRAPTGRSTRRTTVGSGAQVGVPSEAPGHPEDDPGDPEAVARAICLRLLTSAARPRAGLAAALARKGIPEEVATRVLDRLTEVGLVDDAAYAQSYVATRHRHGALGAGALRDELTRKGIDASTAASAVAVVDREAEYERARVLLERRVDSAMAHGPDTARRRLLGLLARRGYSAELSQQVVREVMADYGTETTAMWS